MKKIYYYCLIISFIQLITGCATQGNEKIKFIESGSDSGLSKNMSERDVEILYGTPQSHIVFIDQQQIWIYSYKKTTASLQNYIQELRLFTGQQNEYHKELVILFGSDKKVKKWRINENIIREGTGIWTKGKGLVFMDK